MRLAGGRTIGGTLVSSPQPISTGTYPGTSCPAGQVVIKRGRDTNRPIGRRDTVTCGYPPRPAPIIAAPPPPPPPIITTVSPTFQQAFTPQVSPTIQTQVDSPYGTQRGGTEQTVSTPQEAAGGSSASPAGISASELAVILAEQEAARSAETARERALQQTRDEEQAALREEFFSQAATIDQGAAPSPLTMPLIDTPQIPAPEKTPPEKPSFFTFGSIAGAGIVLFLLYSVTQKRPKK